MEENWKKSFDEYVIKIIKLIYVQLQKIVSEFFIILHNNTYEAQFGSSKIKNNYLINNIILKLYDSSIIIEKGNKIFINDNIYSNLFKIFLFFIF